MDSYRVRVADPRGAGNSAELIDATFANSAFETTTSTENAFVRAIAEQIGDVGAIVMAILGPVLFTLLLVCGNAMAQSVRERTNELAVLKTLGFTDGRVMGLVLIESFVLAVAGGRGRVCGVVPHSANESDWWHRYRCRRLTPFEMALGALIAVLVGLTAGIVPAWQVRRLTIVDALRRAT